MSETTIMPDFMNPPPINSRMPETQTQRRRNRSAKSEDPVIDNEQSRDTVAQYIKKNQTMIIATIVMIVVLIVLILWYMGKKESEEKPKPAVQPAPTPPSPPSPPQPAPQPTPQQQQQIPQPISAPVESMRQQNAISAKRVRFASHEAVMENIDDEELIRNATREAKMSSKNSAADPPIDEEEDRTDED